MFQFIFNLQVDEYSSKYLTNNRGENNIMDRISIIVPVYNVEMYIRECLDSLVTQSYKDVEIILVDDGSTDGSGLICDEYSQKYHFVKSIHITNSGVSCARNVGLERATGKYIGFVDPDDYVDSEMFEKLYVAMIENGADMSMCRECAFVDGEKVKNIPNEKYIIESGTQFANHLLDDWRGPFTWTWNKLFKQDIIGDIRFNETYSVMEDIDFIVSICHNVNKYVDIGERLYFYRQRASSAMGVKSEKKLLDYISVSEMEFDKLYGKYSEEFDRKHLIKILAQIRQIKREAHNSNYAYAENQASIAWNKLYTTHKQLLPLLERVKSSFNIC